MPIQASPANTPDTLPRQQITIAIQGYQFQLVMPYAEGHVLTDIEAGVLNREWTNGVRTNFAEKIRDELVIAAEDGRSIDHHALAKLQSDLLHYADGYSFKALIQKFNSDPIVREAHKIAKGLLDTKLNAEGKTRESIGEAKYEQTLSRIMNHPQVVLDATARVESTRNAANDLIGLES